MQRSIDRFVDACFRVNHASEVIKHLRRLIFDDAVWDEGRKNAKDVEYGRCGGQGGEDGVVGRIVGGGDGVACLMGVLADRERESVEEGHGGKTHRLLHLQVLWPKW